LTKVKFDLTAGSYGDCGLAVEKPVSGAKAFEIFWRVKSKERSEMIKSKLMVATLFCIGPMTLGLAQDLDAGANSFKKCAPCHDIGETAKNKVGPLMNGLGGRKTGTIPGYNYSDANKNSGIVWSEETFLDYIKDPKAKIPGTKMVFAGIKNESEAKNLWAYLSQFGAEGKKK
jgi:cytochrome c